tara:strand:- start:130 stop:390 length:261 start_codon:yes stop_codon:yes gene_type:complete
MKEENIPVIEKNIPIPEPNYKLKSYKWKCIELMTNMDIGDSIKIENRSLAQVKYTWLWRASRKLGLENAFKITPIDKNNHRVWRIK